MTEPFIEYETAPTQLQTGDKPVWIKTCANCNHQQVNGDKYCKNCKENTHKRTETFGLKH